MIIGRDFVDEYYEDEKLYSTGDDYLDDLLEKAFCEGYEYAQKDFSLKNKLKAIPRHIKRNLENTKLGIKMAAGKENLTNEEVGKYAALAKTKFKRMKAGKDKLKSKMLDMSVDKYGKRAEQFARAYKKGWRAEANIFPGHYVFNG